MSRSENDCRMERLSGTMLDARALKSGIGDKENLCGFGSQWCAREDNV
jgi:hypothetical protein